MKRKATRGDITSFSTVYRDTARAYHEFGSALVQAALFTVLIPVHLVVWLWLPELDTVEKERREAVDRAWADADV